MLITYNDELFHLFKSVLGEIFLGIPKKYLPEKILSNITVCEELFYRIKSARKSKTEFELSYLEIEIIPECIEFVLSYLRPDDFHSRTGIVYDEAKKLKTYFTLKYNVNGTT